MSGDWVTSESIGGRAIALNSSQSEKKAKEYLNTDWLSSAAAAGQARKLEAVKKAFEQGQPKRAYNLLESVISFLREGEK